MTGFSNVLSGLSHLPKHIIEWLSGGKSDLAKSLAAVLDELVAYEKLHGAEELEKAGKAGLDAYTAARTTGKSKGVAILSGVAAAFESDAVHIELISTNAMQAYVAGKTA